jgi:hypothetical protein
MESWRLTRGIFRAGNYSRCYWFECNKFEEVKYPQQILSLFSTITGWGEIFPEFKTGTYSLTPMERFLIVILELM